MRVRNILQKAGTRKQRPVFQEFNDSGKRPVDR